MAKPIILKIDLIEPDEITIEVAVSYLKKGNVIAFPTDTFYALGADASNVEAYKKIFEIKKRRLTKPIILLADSIDMIKSFITGYNETIKKLSKAFFPGRLTMVFKAGFHAPGYLSSNEGKISFRIPDSILCRKIIKKLGAPITGTSANISGKEPAKSAEDILSYFKDNVPLILDGGSSEEKRPSTLLDVSTDPPKILRVGAIEPEKLRKVVDCE
jgi:L-threonylcarbamoyladenylate synthase